MKAFCGFSLAVMFERFGIVLGYLVGFVFALLWLTMGRRSIENNKIKWTGRIFGGIYTVCVLLCVAVRVSECVCEYIFIHRCVVCDGYTCEN